MKKAGRNDPCPCGSGSKYKKCCEIKKAQPRKFSAQILSAGSEKVTDKVNTLSKIFQRPVDSESKET
ncbi:MAG: SEC-C domain-containing protein [Simkania sp.]|nr:SEC-C domain-containing protein [Simkania sp.]